jgi:3-oxoacyl-[acyl-carrier-protein] synthase II
MNGHRVVITGVGMVSPIGNSLDAVSESLQGDRTGVRIFPPLAGIAHMKTRVGAPVEVDLSTIPKKRTRTMGRVALLSTWATQQAITDAGLEPDLLSSGRLGLAYGSTGGSTSDEGDFVERIFVRKSLEGILAKQYLKFMSQTCAANVAQYFSIRGRVYTTCSGCVSSSQALGFGYEAVKNGTQEVMICGGAEELDVTPAAIFDLMMATSTRYNDRPSETPRPFDAERDGLVLGEGAGTMVLERYDLAKARGAKMYAEIIGFGTNCDGLHMTAPSEDGLAGAIRLALEDARLSADKIDYVNAHATGTDLGDTCESRATLRVMGDAVPVASTKGFTGHTLGACGVLESAFCVAMLRDGFLAPNRNLTRVHSDCAPLNYIMGPAREAKPKILMTNNAAFAGLNTSLILRAL